MFLALNVNIFPLWQFSMALNLNSIDAGVQRRCGHSDHDHCEAVVHQKGVRDLQEERVQHQV